MQPNSTSRTRWLSAALPAVAISASCAVAHAQTDTNAQALRPPSAPLITHDPYFSIWSNYDKLTDGPTRHWTGSEQSLCSLIRIDGETFRLMGDSPADLPALPQTSLQVLPTRTIYNFSNAKAQVTLTFTTPALPTDLDIVSRPVTYLTWDVKSNDGKSHRVAIYNDASSQIAVNEPNQPVVWQREKFGDLSSLRIGTQAQPILSKSGDHIRIDWGYVYAVAPMKNSQSRLTSRDLAIGDFKPDGVLNGRDEASTPRAAPDNSLVAATSFDLGRVGTKSVSRFMMIGYDDLYSINYMGKYLRPYWRRNGMDAKGLMQIAARDYPSLQKRCADFDTALMRDLTARGGEKYAQICALSHRQSLAANKIVADANGQPLMFSKENDSNGSIGTVDVFYPALPHFLFMAPTLAKATLVPMLNYASSERWKFPFAPHDVGTYPKATGQTYGGGEKTEENQMPVEETGNMLILLAAVSKIDGNAKFADKWWPTLARWTEYLADKGFDPENQLSTDDFSGHLAHNVNLSIKAIMGIKSYAMMARMKGDTASADKYDALSRELAAKWVQEANDGDHFRLAFDRPGTWSQKYNLVWDEILGYNLFPRAAIDKEYAFYKTQFNEFGLPLDNRQGYTKLDWSIWTATLAPNRTDFDAIVNRVYKFIDESPDRAPLTDWYRTKEPRKVGFTARPVIGGVFLPMLSDAQLWNKWDKRDANNINVNSWASMPKPPIVKTIVETSETTPKMWRYTTEKPADNWFAANYDDNNWQQGEGGFGEGAPGSTPRTRWNSSDIWIRRSFEMPAGAIPANLQLLMYHDEDADVYINGVLAAQVGGFTAKYEPIPLLPQGRAALKAGANNVMAIHVHQTGGGQYIDAGLATVTPQE